MFDGHKGVRLMNDYAAVWPLWWSDGGQVREGELPLSADLVSALLAWAESFEEHFRYQSGWDSREAEAKHAETARLLVSALTDELHGMLEVETQLWELRG